MMGKNEEVEEIKEEVREDDGKVVGGEEDRRDVSRGNVRDIDGR